MKKIQSVVVKQPKALYQLRIGTRITAIVILFVVFIGLFLSKNYMIERKVLVNASNEQVVAYLSEPNNWLNWLYIKDGQLSYKGLGSTLIEFDINYDSGKKGLITLDSIDDGFIYFTVIPVLGQNPVSNVIRWNDDADNLMQVSWVISGNLESGLFSSYLAFFADKIAGSNFEKSLQQLKKELVF